MKGPPSVLTHKTQNIVLPIDAPVVQQVTPQYPPCVPMFCRGTYVNSRRLIDHLNQICSDSITFNDDTKDYIEMLDPRGDLCFPFP